MTKYRALWLSRYHTAPIFVLSIRYRWLESSAGCSKIIRRPATRLRDANDVQDRKHSSHGSAAWPNDRISGEI
jgi:hypothetical protein